MGRGEYRTNDMLSSKWRDMNLKVRKFNGIYSQKWQTRRSGQSDVMIELESKDQYREEFNAPFTLKRNLILLPSNSSSVFDICLGEEAEESCMNQIGYHVHNGFLEAHYGQDNLSVSCKILQLLLQDKCRRPSSDLMEKR
ncbi:hypothetical protein E3N88_21961 [Mikania micrantha]|uniref:Uncharacterized protein n=1 Tax=Mikania micrantha TaxID=192012 RepID=A0A5N6NAX1_9ASTR|nr:hypothetical protein E3N88_21961 [Mikania micrantha]